MRAINLIVGTLTIAAVAAGISGVLIKQKSRIAQQRSIMRVVFDGGSAAGLRKGGPVNFDGVQAGQILSINLESPRKIVAMITLENSAPIRKDTTAGIEFQGLTGIAAISLVGGAPTAPPVPLDHDGVPVLTADLKDQETMVETVHNIDKYVVSNAPAIKDALQTFQSETASLKDKTAAIDAAVEKAEDIFKGFDTLVTKIDGAIPGFADGNPGQLFDQIKSMRELVDSFKRKSAKVIDDGRKTLVDISEGANAMNVKFGGQPAGPGPRRVPASR
ncbi:organic solvent ABC transporter substrate-binding protein [Bradyrhizobium sp. SSBR45G]|uniref:MlaD family protein n=1 Tax=unclassified Bradyrhizobium TaxID=2631580 RepID=UPI002342933D|nr:MULTISPECIES: MlaD family protein [unclassified Bradyrhizobium]GLH81527.1 organic solvent ABC transporter substrate-binding protein [Bradyrhizobium sp. SSBR45G]GLH88934.1 organic solvent ABC transporter substrate-binding protein [Bradyrhizobium sp. SSBR45R]